MALPIFTKEQMKILIGTPNFTGNMESEVAVRMARCIMKWSKDHEIHWDVVRRTFICRARSMIVSDAINIGADYLFWIDDDAIVTEDFLPRMLAHDKDVVIAPYPMRRPPYQCGVLKSKTGDFEDQSSYYNLDWDDDLKKGLVEVDGGGTHAMLTKVSVYGPPSPQEMNLEEYKAKFPGKVPYPWFVLAPFGGTEDMYFCLMARRCGVKIYCDTDLEAGHMGWPELLTVGNYRAWKRKYGLQDLPTVLSKLPAGSSYIDVESAASSEEMHTTRNTSDVNAVAGNGSGQAI